MSGQKTKAEKLQEELKTISSNGIVADRKNLTEDMCTQFADTREWIREYVVNAFDARARLCSVYGSDNGESITITVEDNGHGMDKKKLLDFNTIFRSTKEGDPQKAVGRHGIGKLSVAAISGQSKFEMQTSTGKECWQMKTGRLLDGDPIILEQISPVPEAGTRFDITFKKDLSLYEEMKRLKAVLDKCVCYLPMDIIIYAPNKKISLPGGNPHWIKKDWNVSEAELGRHYHFTLQGKEYEAVFQFSQSGNELFQNRILVSNRYNLLSCDLEKSIDIPHLNIHVDSPDFELPFGRHCLSNEQVLPELSKHLRTKILPAFMTWLCSKFTEDDIENTGMVFLDEFEKMICAMIQYFPQKGKPWCSLPVFAVKDQTRMSLDELRKTTAKTSSLYIEGEDDVGIDYSVFDAPVLFKDQPGCGLILLKDIFKNKIINLNVKDTVIEVPDGNGNCLDEQEKKFESFLGFHEETLKASSQIHSEKKNSPQNISSLPVSKSMFEVSTVSEESRKASKGLRDIRWRVNYLVNRDGKTPCKTQKFLFKDDSVILNLNYPEVEKLLELSKDDPALAGHWALAMCLADENKILPHLTPESREGLILIDGMAKCGRKEPLDSSKQTESWMKTGYGSVTRNFLRDLRDQSRWLN